MSDEIYLSFCSFSSNQVWSIKMNELELISKITHCSYVVTVNSKKVAVHEKGIGKNKRRDFQKWSTSQWISIKRRSAIVILRLSKHSLHVMGLSPKD